MSPPFKIKRNPDHLTLADYINDNPDPPCPIVGLEYITEFSMPKEALEKAKPGTVTRPFYHCCLEGCCNEQGDSRQMFEHLIEYHHVATWIKVVKGLVAPNQESHLIQLCQQLHDPDIQYMKLQNGIYHTMCRKAKVKLTRDQITQKIKKARRDQQRLQSKSNEKGSRPISMQDITNKTKVKDLNNKLVRINNPIETAVNPGSIFDIDPNRTTSDPDRTTTDPERTDSDPDRTTSDSDNQGLHPMISIKNEVKQEVDYCEGLALRLKEAFKNEKNKSKAMKLNTSNVVKDLDKAKTKLQNDEGKTLREAPIQSPTTKKISLQDYQKKKKSQADNDVHLVVEKKVRPFTQTVPGGSIMKSETRQDGPNDLLQGTTANMSPKPSNTNVVKSPWEDPMLIFKSKITKLVKEQLNMYWAQNNEDMTDSKGVPKRIKIRGTGDYTRICRMFSQKFQAEVKETYLAINDDKLEGIEKINARAYGIEFEIHKYFSEKPEVVPSFR